MNAAEAGSIALAYIKSDRSGSEQVAARMDLEALLADRSRLLDVVRRCAADGSVIAKAALNRTGGPL